MTQNTRQLLQKLALEPHEVLLSHLTGYPETKVKTLTKQLTQNHKVIRYSESDHTYRFYEGGLGIIDFLERVKEKVGTRRAGIDRVRDYLMMADGIEVLGGELASPNAFITDHKLAKNDWQIPQVVQTDRDFRQLLSSTNTLEKEIAQVIYVIADSSEVLTRLQTEINQRLTPKDVNDLNAIQRRLVVCVSQQPADELAQVLFWLEIARQEKIQEWGAAKNEGIKELEEQRDRMLKSLFQNCTYHCHADYKIPESDRKNLNRVLSALFNELYPFVPSVANVDKMAVKKSNSSTTIGNICKRLLNNDFITIEKPQKNVLDPVLVSDWGLLTKTSETYLINEPKNPTIKVAWDYISDLTAVKSKKETLIYLDQLWQTLRQPPYGYNENTFAVLLSAWLAFHHAEVVLRGSFGIPKGKQQVWTQTEPIRAWGKTSVFDKPKELIEKWILPQGKKNKVRPVLVRRQVQPVPQLPATVDYGEARDRWIPTLKTYLENPDDTAPIADLQAQLKDLERAIATLQAPLTAIDDTEALPDQPDLKTVIPLMVQFETALKPVEQEFVTVCPTEADRDRSKGARQRLREILSAFIDEQRAIVATLTTVADCHDHLGNLEDYQQQIAQVHGGR